MGVSRRRNQFLDKFDQSCAVKLHQLLDNCLELVCLDASNFLHAARLNDGFDGVEASGALADDLAEYIQEFTIFVQFEGQDGGIDELAAANEC